MVRHENQQYNFLTLTPELRLDEVVPKKHRKGKNPDQKAVSDFLRRERAAAYDPNARRPSFNRLTRKQQQIYRARKYNEEEKARKWREGVGETSYTAAEKIILDQPVELGAACFDCGRNLLMETILLTKGQSESSLQQEVWCPSCGNPQPKQIKKANHLIDWGR